MFKSKISLILSIAVFIGLATVLSPVKAHAAIEEPCPDGHMVRFNPGQGPGFSELCADHQTGGPTADSTEAAAAAGPTTKPTSQLSTDCTNLENCRIIGYIRDLINFLSVLVGIVVVIMIAVGGVQYSTSRDNPQATAAAKQRISNALLALVAFIFIFAILEFLVPGGVF